MLLPTPSDGAAAGWAQRAAYDRPVTVALLCALGAAFAYGIGSVLQAIGARREAHSEGVDPGLLVKLVQQGPFVVGLVLDAVGAVLTIVALRRLPLFVVQAAIASSLAVIAVLSSRVFGTRLGRVEWGAIATVGIGLILLSLAAGPEAPPHTSRALHIGLLLAVGVVALLALPAGRLKGSHGATALGLLAGIAYGTGNIALRVIRHFGPRHLVVNPSAYAAVLGAVLGVLLFATALQRGSVTGATGALIAAETVLPALFGTLLLHEHARRGREPVAVVGFIITIAAAATLSRFGEGAPVEPEHPAPTG